MQTPFEIASELIGRGEVPDQAMLEDFLSTGGQNLDPVQTAWCAAFVNAALGKGGQKGTGALNARSFLDWGSPVDHPQRGDVAVFSRGDPNGWQGHVGFYDSTNPDGSINVLGGNQGNSVSIARYSADDLLGYRRGDNALATPPFVPDENQNALRMPEVPGYRMPEIAQAPQAMNPLELQMPDFAGSYQRGRDVFSRRFG